MNTGDAALHRRLQTEIDKWPQWKKDYVAQRERERQEEQIADAESFKTRRLIRLFERGEYAAFFSLLLTGKEN